MALSNELRDALAKRRPSRNRRALVDARKGVVHHDIPDHDSIARQYYDQNTDGEPGPNTENPITDDPDNIDDPEVSEVLKKYTESIMRKVEPKESERIIANADERLQFQRMIESFAQEPLIRFIQMHTTKTPADLLKLLETSDSLSHFLEKANVLDPATLDVSNSESAQHDYQNILRRYFTQNTEDRGLDSREENDKQESKRRRPTSKARKTQIN